MAQRKRAKKRKLPIEKIPYVSHYWVIILIRIIINCTYKNKTFPRLIGTTMFSPTPNQKYYLMEAIALLILLSCRPGILFLMGMQRVRVNQTSTQTMLNPLNLKYVFLCLLY